IDGGYGNNIPSTVIDCTGTRLLLLDKVWVNYRIFCRRRFEECPKVMTFGTLFFSEFKIKNHQIKKGMTRYSGI
ncbi:MAG TPA: hypothetical protein K8V05_13335, partial [Butyricimonas virosa]|nr:hypothetical protein [Butyricimonas virosa]